MALRLKHNESITVGKEGIKLGGSFSLTSDELGRLEGKDIKRKIGSVKGRIHSKARSSTRFIERKSSQLGKIVRKAPKPNKS